MSSTERASRKTSETEGTSAVGDTAEGSKNRTITGTSLKGLFRTAVRAITRRGEDEMPEPARRRREERGGDFQRLARNIARRFSVARQFRERAAITSRYLAIPATIFDAASRYVFDAFDTINQWNKDAGHDDDFGENFDTWQNRNSLDP